MAKLAVTSPELGNRSESLLNTRAVEPQCSGILKTSDRTSLVEASCKVGARHGHHKSFIQCQFTNLHPKQAKLCIARSRRVELYLASIFWQTEEKFRVERNLFIVVVMEALEHVGDRFLLTMNIASNAALPLFLHPDRFAVC
jgi:hypothetical protein